MVCMHTHFVSLRRWLLVFFFSFCVLSIIENKIYGIENRELAIACVGQINIRRTRIDKEIKHKHIASSNSSTEMYTEHTKT